MNSNTESKILFKDEVFAIQGAVFEVYRQMGSGFLEAVYQECLQREFQNAQVFNYLRATGYRLALLVNFGHYPKATVERIIL